MVRPGCTAIRRPCRARAERPPGWIRRKKYDTISFCSISWRLPNLRSIYALVRFMFLSCPAAHFHMGAGIKYEPAQVGSEDNAKQETGRRRPMNNSPDASIEKVSPMQQPLGSDGPARWKDRTRGLVLGKRIAVGKDKVGVGWRVRVNSRLSAVMRNVRSCQAIAKSSSAGAL